MRLSTSLAAAAAAISFQTASAEPAACSADVPAALQAPAGNAFAFEFRAEGAQVYGCAASGGAFAWALQGPDATLVGPDGLVGGKHYAGPTWEAGDGSKVAGAKVEGATPDPAAIPWLLLRATSHAGGGRMGDVTFVQRVMTSGGNAPAGGCDASHTGAVARVPYRAIYCFYRKQ
jgi:hypothetical protein